MPSTLTPKVPAARARTTLSTDRRRSPERKGGTRILVVASTDLQRSRLAQEVSDELNRKLHRVDLSRIVSTHVGETEKNLRRAFEAAESARAILYFEEADALFGRRTDVKDAHDRYANQEVSYLLERMERSSAVTIVGTNSIRNIDPAFARRLRFSIKLTEAVVRKRRSPRTKSTTQRRRVAA